VRANAGERSKLFRTNLTGPQCDSLWKAFSEKGLAKAAAKEEGGAARRADKGSGQLGLAVGMGAAAAGSGR
jgi:hypothetical protein